jgi:uncharacterized protein YyaL (SSP411 family)
MLYDQALLVMVYTEAYQATHNPAFRKTAEEIISYVLRDLTSPEGAFFSAEDADSAGGEGAFYLWTADETEKILGKDDAIIAARIFGITPTGNYQDAGTGRGQNILYRKKSIEEVASSSGIPETDLEILIESIRARLFTAQSQRSRPSLDDKVLTDGNGLFIAALAQAGRTFGNEKYLAAASRAMQFVLTRMRSPDGGLLHRYRDGEPAIPAFGDDYAFAIKALIELYESTFEPGYLSSARELNIFFLAHFWDEVQGAFFTIADTEEILLVRKKEIYDGAIPSCNSVACENLVKLAHLTGDVSYEQRASELSCCFAAPVHESPSGHTWFLCALDSAIGPVHDVVIVGERDADDTQEMIKVLRDHYLPCVMIVYRPTGEDDLQISSLAPFTRTMKASGGKATAYICTGNSCAKPITEPHEMLALLGCMNPDT